MTATVKKNIFRIFSLLIWLAPGLAPAVTPSELSNQAQADYQAGRFAEAIKNWQELSEMGFLNGDLYYNIGSAYWRMGKVGQARRQFLIARNWSPRDPEIRQNLAFIESKVEKPRPLEGPRAVLAKIPFYRFSLNASESLVCSAISSVVLFGFLALFRWKRKPAYALLSGLAALLLLFGLGQIGGSGTISVSGQPAIVLSPKLPLREGPLPEAATQEELNEGSLVSLKKSQGDFALVKSASGKEGWVDKASLGEIP
ncbi:MAG: hypothetical protein K8R69_02515 [Deltaproteobacteria bacterium]|nr:hypothetical protein [Deltaproteobacteria bacterium]